MNSKYIKRTVNINSLIIILEDIFYEYPKLSNDLRKLLRNETKENICFKLEKVLHHKFGIEYPKIRHFYKENKLAINMIDKKDYIFSFIFEFFENYNLDYFYRYFKRNIDQKDNILMLLKHLKDLQINRITFNQEYDFTKEIYNIDNYIENVDEYDKELNYVDNIEIVPNYQDKKIIYKTNDSNYKIVFPKKMHLDNDIEIFMNSLTFDYHRLPENHRLLEKNTILKYLHKLRKEKEDIFNAIKNSIDLDIYFNDIDNKLIDTIEKVRSLNLENKESLLELLKGFRDNFKVLLLESEKYEQNIIDKGLVTEEVLDNEKDSVKRVRNIKQNY